MAFILPRLNKKIKVNSKLELYTSLAGQFGCSICTLQKNVHTPNMKPSGSNKPLIYIIGEAPGYQEDEEGIQFVGKSGQYLRSIYNTILPKIPTRFSNVCRCRPPANRKPKDIEIECCRKSVQNDIVETKPKIIIGFGATPFKWAFNRGDAISLWRGRKIPIKILNHTCWFIPIFHPAFIIRGLRSSGYDKLDHCFTMDLKFVKKIIGENETPVVIEKEEILSNTILVCKDIEIKQLLYKLIKHEYISIDIETQGKKPYENNARILSIAIGTKDKTYAIPFDIFYKDTELFKKFILNSGRKIVHNLQFELEWFCSHFGNDLIWSTEWEDTMSQAFVLDERKIAQGIETKGTGKGALGLNDLALIHFGFELKKYSKINYNSVVKTPLEDLLQGNGLDAKWTYKLFFAQNKQLDSKSVTVYKEHVDTARTLALTQKKGVCVDLFEIERHDTEISVRLSNTHIKIKALPEFKEFKKVFGYEFNPGSSSKDMPKMFYNILKMNKIAADKKNKKKDTETKESFTLDKNALAEYAGKGCVLAQLIPEYRSLVTLLARYGKKGMDSVIQDDGLVHTNFNHLFASTGRLTSSEPNLQNYNKRFNKEVRSIIVPIEGCLLVAFDYGQIEARLVGVASKDKTLCEKIWNGYDIHMDWAIKIAILYPSIIGGRKYLKDIKVMKDFRQIVKNKMVFPSIYGASVNSVAMALNVPIKIMYRIMDEFWDTFRDVKNWQQDLFDFYIEHGYVESLLGKRRHMPLDYTQIGNDTIQGVAAYVVKGSMNRLSKIAQTNDKQQYQAILNIHDDLTFVLPEKTLEEDIKFIAKEMVAIVPPFSFIDVPLEVEVEVGPNWADMEFIAKFCTTDFFEMKRI